MRAIGYFRETKRQSLADQSESFLEFCRRNGYEATATFLDAKTQSDLWRSERFHAHMAERQKTTDKQITQS